MTKEIQDKLRRLFLVLVAVFWAIAITEISIGGNTSLIMVEGIVIGLQFGILISIGVVKGYADNSVPNQH